MPRAEAAQAFGGDEQAGVVAARRWSAGHALPHRDDEEPRPQRGVDRVAHEGAARPEHAQRFADDAVEVLHVLEHLARDDHLERRVGEGQGGGVGEDRLDPLAGGDVERALGEIDAHMTVADHVRRQQPSAAPDVEEPRMGAVRWGNEPRPGASEPMQGGERAVRLPPVLNQIVVLAQVVACAPRSRGHAARLGLGEPRP